MNGVIVRSGTTPSRKEVGKAISTSVKSAFDSSKGNVGILLSGGVDSTLLFEFVTKLGKVIPAFTVASNSNHLDIKAAERVANEYGLEHYILLPDEKDIARAKEAIKDRGNLHKGDIAVYLALELAKSKGVDTVLTGDGIDELTGGYWWHANTSDRFRSKEEAFKYFWDRLNPDHIEPLLDSAAKVGIKVKLPYLDKALISVLTRIPLDERVKGNVTKNWWKEFAKNYVPECIAYRAKLGFASALGGG